MGNKLPVSPQVFPFEFASPMKLHWFPVESNQDVGAGQQGSESNCSFQEMSTPLCTGPTGEDWSAYCTTTSNACRHHILLKRKVKSIWLNWPFTASTVYLQLQHVCKGSFTFQRWLWAGWVTWWSHENVMIFISTHFVKITLPLIG